jgi:hypothetical protein
MLRNHVVKRDRRIFLKGYEGFGFNENSRDEIDQNFYSLYDSSRSSLKGSEVLQSFSEIFSKDSSMDQTLRFYAAIYDDFFIDFSFFKKWVRDALEYLLEISGSEKERQHLFKRGLRSAHSR